ncbi:MAG: hypothetical protein ACTS45_01365 [Candidatus Hodgkinia cicadicola]
MSKGLERAEGETMAPSEGWWEREREVSGDPLRDGAICWLGSPVSINEIARGLTGELNVSDVFWEKNCAKSPREWSISPLSPPPEAPSRESWSLSLGSSGGEGLFFFCCGRFKSGDFGRLNDLFHSP